MRIVAVVQARMGSSRLPGKVLATIGGHPMIRHVLFRASQSMADAIVLATSTHKEDDALAKAVESMGFQVVRGSLEDVLDRFHKTAVATSADVVVRLTGDCPLVDPEQIDRCIGMFRTGNYDYVSNAYPKATFPDGLDTEVMSAKVLELAWREADKPSEREHVTSFIWNRPERFRLGSVHSPQDFSHLRWTVDESRDLVFVRELYSMLDPDTARMADVLELLKRNPDLLEINREIERNEGYRRSLAQDVENGCP